MKSIVIYFSQSGNTKKLGQAICEGIREESGQCDLIRMQDFPPERWTEYDLIGIGTPIWGGSPTSNVLRYMQALPELRGKYAFYYCTHGCTPGRCISSGVKPLQEKGLTVIGWRDWYGSGSIPGHAKPWFTDGHPDDIDLIEARSFGRAMARHSVRITGGCIELIPTLPTPEAEDYIYAGSPNDMPPMPDGAPGDGMEPPPGGGPMIDPVHMEIDAAKCIGCGRCLQACHDDNIDGSTMPPTFKRDGCVCVGKYCEGVCPTGAIVLDFPETMVGPEMRKNMETVLGLAEARGRFRRLVKEEEIGWDTPWEKVTTHPRFKEIP